VLHQQVFYLSSLAFHAPSEFTFQGYRPDLSVYLYHHTSKKQVAVAVISFNTSHASSGFLDSLIPYLPINTTSSYVRTHHSLSLSLSAPSGRVRAGTHYRVVGSSRGGGWWWLVVTGGDWWWLVVAGGGCRSRWSLIWRAWWRSRSRRGTTRCPGR
jgi:hypothetical protein